MKELKKTESSIKGGRGKEKKNEREQREKEGFYSRHSLFMKLKEDADARGKNKVKEDYPKLISTNNLGN